MQKLIRAYGVGSKQHEPHKQNQNPAERRIQDIKGTTRTVLDFFGAPIWSWLLCMAYVVLIINYIAHRPLSWRNTHKTAYLFTPVVAHLMEF